ncbi:ParA family protein [Deinococcus sp. SDU3-2]|uniref:ParA family protein n=1 Tax=Deinococcus terrestris TaxID=2651870 RepID=A0A7X1TSN0_9DEIO|nr:ParA family protein [Deinococcus terrestris]MPY67990.1 ParA family protein [Deinococcus terrestris]
MKIVTVFNHAGGAGKTSITRDVGYTLAQAGQRVLLIDLDPQANLTTWLGLGDVDLEDTAHVVATAGRPLPLPREVHGLQLIPSRVDLALAEAMMPGVIGAEMSLRKALGAVRPNYDLVIIDSPPSVGKLAAMGALAADHLIVPVPTRHKGLDALPGLQAVMNMYHNLRPELTVGLYVPTMYDARRSHDREVLQQLKQYLSPLAEPVPQREAVWMDSSLAGQPVGLFAPNSPVGQDVLRLTADVARILDLPFEVRS